MCSTCDETKTVIHTTLAGAKVIGECLNFFILNMNNEVRITNPTLLDIAESIHSIITRPTFDIQRDVLNPLVNSSPKIGLASEKSTDNLTEYPRPMGVQLLDAIGAMTPKDHNVN